MLPHLPYWTIALPLGLLWCMTVGCKTPCTDTVDICGFALFKAAPPTTAAQAGVVISGYTDPIVRAAAVGFWIGLHPQTPAAEATALCALLEPQEQRGCLRRVTSPHLNPVNR